MGAQREADEEGVNLLWAKSGSHRDDDEEWDRSAVDSHVPT